MTSGIITKKLIEARIQMDKVNKKRLSKPIIIMLQNYYGEIFFTENLQIIFTKIIADFPEINLTENKLRLIRYRHNHKKSSDTIQKAVNKTASIITSPEEVEVKDKQVKVSIVDQIFSNKTN